MIKVSQRGRCLSSYLVLQVGNLQMVQEHGLKRERGKKPQSADSAAQASREISDFSSGNSPERQEEKSSHNGGRFCGEQVQNEETSVNLRRLSLAFVAVTSPPAPVGARAAAGCRS